MEESEINFFYETGFRLDLEKKYETWIRNVITSEEKLTGLLNFIFVDDTYLHEMNMQYLDHDTLTDIISFDTSENDVLNGDVFISIERVEDNAKSFNAEFIEELKRVMIHGILHFVGYKDKTESEKSLMRQKEEEKIKLFHVEQS